MGIEGVGIIDSDLAHDIYNEFLDLYDSGLPVPEIRLRIDSWQYELADDLEREIFLSVYCQVLWEIGELKEKDLSSLRASVESESGLKLWSSSGVDIYNARKKILQSQLRRLSKLRTKSRRRKKWHKVQRLLFDVGECIIYKHSNGKSYPLLVCDIDQYRGECLYSMVPIVVNRNADVTIEVIRDGMFVGHEIKSTLHRQGFVYGFACVRPEHRELIKYSDAFLSIGRVVIRTEDSDIGSFGGILTKDDFEEELVRIVEKRDQFHNLLPVSAVIV